MIFMTLCDVCSVIYSEHILIRLIQRIYGGPIVSNIASQGGCSCNWRGGRGNGELCGALRALVG